MKKKGCVVVIMKGPGPWKLPPKVKLYEALGALADGRVALRTTVLCSDCKLPDPAAVQVDLGCGGESGAPPPAFTVTSSNGDKKYDVRLRPLCDSFDPGKPFALSCNDNGSLFQGYVGYPALAVLVFYGILRPAGCSAGEDGSRREVEAAMAALRGMKWKTMATKHKNDWDKVVADALAAMEPAARSVVTSTVDALHADLEGRVLALCERFSKPVKRGRE